MQSPLVRLKLVGRLSALNKQISETPRDTKNALARLKLNAERRDVISQLTGSAGAIQKPTLEPIPGPEPILESDNGPADNQQQNSENIHIATLREIVTGVLDRIGVIDLFYRLNEAISALNESGLLSGDVEASADAAITHWAQLEASSG